MGQLGSPSSMKIKIRNNMITMLLVMANAAALAGESIYLSSETGDNLMLHKLSSDQLWATFQITDQVVESFAMQELIVLQVDQNKPVKLQQSKKVCGAPKSKDAQTIDYVFNPAQAESRGWAFNAVTTARQNPLKTLGWDDATYDTLKSDRRTEFVDFPLIPIISDSPNLWQQFEQGKQVTFRYVTEAGEARQAMFSLEDIQQDMVMLKK